MARSPVQASARNRLRMRVFIRYLLLHEPVKSAGDTGGGIGHGDHRAVAGDVCQGLPAWAGKGIGVAHGVILAKFALNRDHEIAVHGGWRKEDGRGLNPKTALNGKAGAAGHGGERLGDSAGQLKTGAAAERSPTARHYASGNIEPRAALGEGSAGKRNQQEQR